MKVPKDIREQALAGAILMEASGKSSSALDSFSSWLLGGVGAAFALLVGSLGEISKYLPVSALRCAGLLFVAGAAFAALQKFIASIIGAASQSSAVSRELGEKAGSSGDSLDMEKVFSLAKQSLIWPLSKPLDAVLTKAREGDWVAAPRMFAKLGQFQAILVAAQTGLLLSAILVVFCALVG